MKKKVFILIACINSLAFAKITEELTINKNGKFSGNASLQLVAKGRVIESPNRKIFVIQEDEKNNFKSEIIESSIEKKLVSSSNKNKIRTQITKEKIQLVSKDNDFYTKKIINVLVE